MNSNQTLANGVFGMIATAGSIMTSFQSEIEWWLRVSSLVIGIAVGLLTLRNLIKKL
jgi:hypothetical protein